MNKYHAKRADCDGRSFHSQGERDCYLYLKLLERAGEIDTIECQVTTRFPIQGLTHKTDFKYWDCKLGETVWAEFKGMEDQRWRDIKKIWKYCGPGRLREYRGRGSRIYVYEEIIPDALRKMPETKT